MKPVKYTVQASTLPEVLILMILTGIVFLGVMDGMRLLGALVTATAERITSNSLLYTNYERLDDLIYTSDSMLSREGKLLIYREGEMCAMLCRRDSCLTIQLKAGTDTLFESLVAWDTLPESNFGNSSGIDSLCITLQIPPDSAIDLSFGRSRALGRQAWAELISTEEKYGYED